MIDQGLDITDALHNSTIPYVDDLEELARGADGGRMFHADPGDIILALVFGISILVSALYMSRSYRIQEQRELAETERNRIEEEKKKIEHMENYRSKITKVIESYAIHLTNITSRSSVSGPSRHGAVSLGRSERDCGDAVTRELSSGEEDGSAPVETITIQTDDSSSEDIEIGGESSHDDNSLDDTEEHHSESPEYDTPLRSTLTIDGGDQTPHTEDDDQPASSSSSAATTITRANLREAVRGNPCSICLEPFKAGDDIVCCSNKIPHVFHRACALDYIVTHTDGIQAPCPCCRKVLLPLEKPKGCFRHSHSSALTLPDLNNQDDENVSEGSESSGAPEIDTA